jgi:hypothetical protein
LDQALQIPHLKSQRLLRLNKGFEVPQGLESEKMLNLGGVLKENDFLAPGSRECSQSSCDERAIKTEITPVSAGDRPGSDSMSTEPQSNQPSHKND